MNVQTWKGEVGDGMKGEVSIFLCDKGQQKIFLIDLSKDICSQTKHARPLSAWLQFKRLQQIAVHQLNFFFELLLG